MPAGNWLSEVLGFKSMSCNSTLLKFQNKINLFFPSKPEIVSISGNGTAFPWAGSLKSLLPQYLSELSPTQ